MSLQPERRQNTDLRAKVDAALVLIAPFFDPANAWAGHGQELLAFRTLRDHMPELDATEVHVIVSVAQRVARERAARAV